MFNEACVYWIRNESHNSSTCKGMKWWNNDIVTIMSKEHPGENFKPGRIFHKKNKEN